MMLPERPGAVVCAALNFRATLDKLAPQLNADPYKQPPRAPVLYLKPPNTYNKPGDPIPCPAGAEMLRMGGTLGIVLGRAATRVPAHQAAEFIAGYCVMNDVSLPHTSYYRPAIKERCRDGFHVLGPGVAAAAVANPDQLAIRIFVNDELAAENSTANLVRSIGQLLADVSEFMTLAAGDILTVGEPDNAPLAFPGDRVRIDIPGVGSVVNSIIPERILGIRA